MRVDRTICRVERQQIGIICGRTYGVLQKDHYNFTRLHPVRIQKRMSNFTKCAGEARHPGGV